MASEQELASITLAVGAHQLTATMAKPAGRVSADALLPLIDQFVDGEIAVRIAEQEASGHKVSCCKGCSACCRAQPVPITSPEVRRLQRVVANLPDEKRRRVMSRFEANGEALKNAGLVQEYFRPRHELDPTSAKEIARRYIALRLVCPFLEEDSCSIYEQRPFVCRQYLVSSDPVLCERPMESAVEVMPVRLKPASATLKTMTHTTGRSHATVPLALLFEYAQHHQAEMDREYDAETLARTWLHYLCE